MPHTLHLCTLPPPRQGLGPLVVWPALTLPAPPSPPPSLQVGAKLRIKLDLSHHHDTQQHIVNPKKATNVGGASTPRYVSKSVLAWLIYLQSWKDMGMARLTCEDGCTCAPTVVDGILHGSAIKATTPNLFYFPIDTRDANSTHCIVQVGGRGR